MGRSSTQWLCVWLRSLEDRLSEGGVEEHIRVIGRILGLKETSEFRAGGSPLAKYRIPVRGGFGGEILTREGPYTSIYVCYIQGTYRRRVLFGLSILLREGNHVGLGCSIKLPARV